jgi:hypothetical protein
VPGESQRADVSSMLEVAAVWSFAASHRLLRFVLQLSRCRATLPRSLLHLSLLCPLASEVNLHTVDNNDYLCENSSPFDVVAVTDCLALSLCQPLSWETTPAQHRHALHEVIHQCVPAEVARMTERR